MTPETGNTFNDQEPEGKLSELGGSGASGRLRQLLTQLYRKFWTELCRFIQFRYGDGPPPPEDVVQQAFTQFAALEDPWSVDNPRAFLLRTASNISIDHKRQQQRHNRLLKLAQPTGEEEPLDELEPMRVLLAKEQFALVRRALETMPEQRRKLFLLHRLQGLSYVELAKTSGLSPTTVKYHVAQALYECSEALAGYRKD